MKVMDKNNLDTSSAEEISSIARRCGKSMPQTQEEEYLDTHDFGEGMDEFADYEASKAVFDNDDEDSANVESPISQGKESGRYVPLGSLSMLTSVGGLSIQHDGHT